MIIFGPNLATAKRRNKQLVQYTGLSVHLTTSYLIKKSKCDDLLQIYNQENDLMHCTTVTHL